FRSPGLSRVRSWSRMWGRARCRRWPWRRTTGVLSAYQSALLAPRHRTVFTWRVALATNAESPSPSEPRSPCEGKCGRWRELSRAPRWTPERRLATEKGGAVAIQRRRCLGRARQLLGRQFRSGISPPRNELELSPHL